MTTKRENILAAIKTALANTTGVGTRIYRTRVDPVARAESPAIIIQPVRDVAVQNTSLPTLDWTMTVRITVIERSDVPDQAADDTIESLHAKVMSDLTLGGYAIDVQPVRTEFEFIEADKPAALISCEFEVRYRTEVDDLTQ
jgi:hypothetical protein|tara:strand:- start:847 stop:1272 length:426 start_codon:yes stop_codon:yes gene_type:complete